MRPDDPSAALRDIADQLPGLQGEVEGLRAEVQESRRTITWLRRAWAVLALIACGAVAWTAYQQTVLDAKSAAIARLADQNAGRTANDARHAHDLCVKLNQTRGELLPVWEKVLSERPDDARLIPVVEAAVPLGRCPAAPPARH